MLERIPEDDQAVEGADPDCQIANTTTTRVMTPHARSRGQSMHGDSSNHTPVSAADIDYNSPVAPVGGSPLSSPRPLDSPTLHRMHAALSSSSPRSGSAGSSNNNSYISPGNAATHTSRRVDPGHVGLMGQPSAEYDKMRETETEDDALAREYHETARQSLADCNVEMITSELLALNSFASPIKAKSGHLPHKQSRGGGHLHHESGEVVLMLEMTDNGDNYFKTMRLRELLDYGACLCLSLCVCVYVCVCACMSLARLHSPPYTPFLLPSLPSSQRRGEAHRRGRQRLRFPSDRTWWQQQQQLW